MLIYCCSAVTSVYRQMHTVNFKTLFARQATFGRMRRAKVVAFMINIHKYHNLEPGVIFVAVNILDRYIAQTPIDDPTIIALSCLVVAIGVVQDEICDYFCESCDR